jgi:hypothetical protein
LKEFIISRPAVPEIFFKISGKRKEPI